MGEASRLDMDYLVSNPASDANFKYVLERASEETIRGALQEIGDNRRKAAVIKALNSRLKSLLEAQGEQVSEAEKRQTRAVTMDLTTLEAERERQHQVQEAQTDRESRIAQCHEIIGRVQGLQFIEKVTTVGTLMQLRDIKASKAYRDLPSIGTWEDFCKYIGLSRQKVDEDLTNLATFGEEFLTTVGRFSLGYRELRKLRQLTHDGAVVIDGECLTIDNESIPIDPDHAEELQAAIERIIEDKKQLDAKVAKLQKGVDEVVKEETKGLKAEVKALVKRVHELEVFEPKPIDETQFEEQYKAVHDTVATLANQIGKLVMMDGLNENPLLAARIEGFVASAENLVNGLRMDWTAKFQIY